MIIGHRSRALLYALCSALIPVAGLAAGPTPIQKPLSASSGSIEVFVQLSEPSVAELNIDALQSSGALASHEAQQAQAARVDAEQRSFRPHLASIGARELGALRASANGLRVRVDVKQLPALRALPGVRSIGRVSLVKPTNAASVPWIGAPQVWSSLAAKGQHIKIGIIDTGIDYTHANFGGSGNPADYEANNPDVIEPGSFPTAKVKGGYDFAGPTYDARDPTSVPAPDPDPLDGAGHGSHVAGTVAGIGVPGVIGPGVAPEADLYAIKVFGDNGGSTNLVSQGVEWALDPNGDGDVSDHLDVINLSLGSDFGDPNGDSSIAIQHAVKLGVFAVISAGNSGSVPYIVGSPAVAPGAISVASAIPGNHVWAYVNVTAPAAVAGRKTTLEGNGAVQLANIPPISGSLVASAPADGCTALTNAADIAGRVALVRRGTCNFSVKLQMAQNAGASALIVYNDGLDPTRVAPISMDVSGVTSRIPAVMISSTDGFALASAAGSTSASPVQVTLGAATDPTRDDQLSAFSSRGPGAKGTNFKPEITAPGEYINSTLVGSGTGGVIEQGTSMAAPHVTGSAALLRQLHPKFGPEAIKALLMNSTVNANPSGDTDLARQGVGVVRVNQAAALTSYASPAGVAFGRVEGPSFQVVSRTVTVKDFSGRNRTFAVQSVPHRGYPGIKVQCPSSVSVHGGRSTDFQIHLSFDPSAAAKAGVGEDWEASETEIDGWCILSDGKDTLRVGYLASVDADSLVKGRSGTQQVSLTNVGPAAGLAQEFTLVGRGDRTHGRPDPTDRSLAYLGARTALVAGQDTVQLGVALDKPWEHISALYFYALLDVDGDGVPDYELDAADLSQFDSTQAPGTYVTAQFDLKTGAAFLDWVADWDFNDRVATLTYTSASNTAFPGFVPQAFAYSLNVVDLNTGASDTLNGTVDLSKEVVPDVNDFVLASRDSATVGFTGTGDTLWFYPGNSPEDQVDVISVKGKKGGHRAMPGHGRRFQYTGGHNHSRGWSDGRFTE